MTVKRFAMTSVKTIVVFVVFATASYLAYTYVWIPYSDNYVLAHADPAMAKLANEAGMSRKGKLVFLRADPKLVTDAQMQSACADNTAANNSNGFIEQGCYNTATHRIYLREMPGNLHELVVATASYEMLHPVYIDLHTPALDAAIEANYKEISDKHLREQVANFAKTEPDARDLELFSLLATGYSNLSDDLRAYYAPYFNDISKTVSANAEVTKLFNDSQKQLAAAKSQIDAYEKRANAAYASSISWAQAGSQYWDDYYYNLYRSYISKENAAINTYNRLIESYDALVTEYNGTQPVKQLGPAETQTQ